MRERSDRREGRRGRDDRGGSFLDDFAYSVMAVVGIGVLLFAISGIWPPMVAIESGSMEPNIDTGDLVFVMEEDRFPSQYQIEDTGVATASSSPKTGYRKFNRPGDVVVYQRNGNPDATPVIHRAVLWVNESENWYDKADPSHLPNGIGSCDDMRYCPAPHDGFITLGDNEQTNPHYDQVGNSALSEPVRPDWVIGTAEFELPGLGWFRLRAGLQTSGWHLGVAG